MADKDQNQSKPTIEDHVSLRVEGFLAYVTKDLFPKHGPKLLVVAFLLVVGIFILVQQRNQAAQTNAVLTEELGKAMDHLYNSRSDSAATILQSLVSQHNANGLVLAKASLLLGNLRLQQDSLAQAAELYAKVISNAGSSKVLMAGAEHGLAVVAMEQKDWPKAIERLESFVKDYGKRTGDLEKRFSKEEKGDLAVTVPGALWKLALCYVEINDTAKAKASAERLLKVYGDSRQAALARKLLATL